MKNYYEILEVNEKASKEIIENAYKTLLQRYKPEDFSGEAQNLVKEKVKEINEAYKIISDDFLREQYDLELKKEKQEEFNVNNIYTKQEKIKQETPKPKEEKTKKVKKVKSKIGTIGGIADVTTEVFSNLPKFKGKPKFTKKGVLAFLSAIAIVLLVGIILWFIPFTNGFIKSFLLID